MRFIETPVFTADVEKLLSDEDYRQLQLALALRPDSGSVIPRSGGLRKVRWKRPGSGKRGGTRVIYYWHTAESMIYLLLIYSKTRRENLTAKQLLTLRVLVEENLE